jgi:vacuolar-type H+-ATPase subunit E/Vma4
MSMETILSRIEEETDAAVRGIIGEAETEASSIAEDYAAEADELKQELDRQARARAGEEERRLLVNEELQLRKRFLEKKHEILEMLYAEASKRITSLEREEYLDLIKRMIVGRAITFKEEIVVPKDQTEIFDSAFLDSLNASSGKKKSAFSISDEAGEFVWGVVLKERRRRIDLTLDVLVAQLRDRIEPQIAAVLFDDEI